MSSHNGLRNGAFLAVLLLAFAGTAAGATLIHGFEAPPRNANLSGSFEVRVNTSTVADVSFVTFTTNRSSGAMANVTAQTTRQTSFGTANMTAMFADGPILFQATAYNGSHVHTVSLQAMIDDTPPRATDAVIIDETLRTSIVTNDLVATTDIPLDWSGATGGEMTDAASGIASVTLLTRNRSYNRDTRRFGAWSPWKPVADVTGMDATTVTRTDLHQHRFRLRVRDHAGNVNRSNVVNATVDVSPPRTTRTGGSPLVSPHGWTGESTPSLTANISDIAGIHNLVGTQSNSQALNLSLHNASRRISFPTVTVTPGQDAIELRVGTVEELGALRHGTRYTAMLHATDLLENRNRSINWSFTPDLEPPRSVGLSRSGDARQGWYRDNVSVTVSCNDPDSGVDAVTIGEQEWVSSGEPVTVTGDGVVYRSVVCRDTVGNVNDSQAAAFRIDSTTPTFQTADPGRQAVVRDTQVTFTVTYTDESDGSGIDRRASSVTLDGGPGSVGVVSWSNTTGSILLQDLEAGNTYTLSGTIIDVVGHRDTFSINFSTAGDAALAFDTPGTVEAEPGETVQIPFNITNTGDSRHTGITVTASASGLGTVTIDGDAFALDPGATEALSAGLVIDEALAPGTYTVHLDASSAEGVNGSGRIDVSIPAPSGTLHLSGPEENISIQRHRETNITYRVRNNGSDAVEDITLTMTVAGQTVRLDPAAFSLPSGTTQAVTAVLSPGNATSIGIHEGVLTAESGSLQDSISTTFHVQPGTAYGRRQVRDRFDTVTARFEEQRERMNASAADSIRTLLSEANRSIRRGEYARAALLHDRIEQQLEADTPASGGIPVLPTVIILLVGVVLIGGIVYLQRRGQTRKTGYGQQRSWQQRGRGYPAQRARQQRGRRRRRAAQGRKDISMIERVRRWINRVRRKVRRALSSGGGSRRQRPVRRRRRRSDRQW